MYSTVKTVEVPRLAVSDILGWYWVRIPTVSIPEFTQFESGKSIILYFPPKGTAGFASFCVSA